MLSLCQSMEAKSRGVYYPVFCLILFLVFNLISDRLHHEMVTFLTFVESTAKEERARELVLSKVKAILESRFSRCEVSTYGSVAYGLSLPDGYVSHNSESIRTYMALRRLVGG